MRMNKIKKKINSNKLLKIFFYKEYKKNDFCFFSNSIYSLLNTNI